MSLPTADDLFRPTAEGEAGAGDRAEEAAAPEPATEEPPRSHSRPARTPRRRSSGRVRHDEKMTVYVTAEELLDLEHARLALRRDQGIAVDRGRLVREALAIVLADLELHGDDSDLVKRLNA